MRDKLFRKGLLLTIIVLFVGVCVYPAVAVEPTRHNKNTIEEDIEPKDYLFQTIIDIANNPDVKSLLEQYTGKIFTFDFNDKSVFRELLHKKPILLISSLFTKPSMTHDYLDSIYKRGIELTSILGEERVYELLNSTKITNTEFFVELDHIIVNDEELSKRITTLAELNGKFKLDSPFKEYPIYCAIIKIIYTSIYSITDFLLVIEDFVGEDTTLSLFVYAMLSYPVVFLDIIGSFLWLMGDGFY